MFCNKLKIINNSSFLFSPNVSVSTAITDPLRLPKFSIIFGFIVQFILGFLILNDSVCLSTVGFFFRPSSCTEPDGYCKLCLALFISFCMMVLLHSPLYPELHYLLLFHFSIVSIILPCKVGEFIFLRIFPLGIVLLNFTVISSFYSSYLRLFNSVTEVGHTQIIHDSKHILLQVLVFSLHANYWKICAPVKAPSSNFVIL